MLLDTRFLLTLFVELSLMYLAVLFVVHTLLQSIDLQRMEPYLRNKRPVGALMAAIGLGALVPFCSCTTVPFTAALGRAGVPFSVVATFLVMSPLVNPAAVAILVTFAGAGYAGVYVVGSAVVALTVGVVMGPLRPNWLGAAPVQVDDAIAGNSCADGGCGAQPKPPAVRTPWASRFRIAGKEAGLEYRKFLPILSIAAVVAALLHNQTAATYVQSVLGNGAWWGVPAAAVVGIPIYASTAVLIPLGSGLYASGIGLEVVTVFLMGATGFSVPEGLMLSKLIGVRTVMTLAAAFFMAVVALGYGLHFVL